MKSDEFKKYIKEKSTSALYLSKELFKETLKQFLLSKNNFYYKPKRIIMKKFSVNVELIKQLAIEEMRRIEKDPKIKRYLDLKFLLEGELREVSSDKLFVKVNFSEERRNNLLNYISNNPPMTLSEIRATFPRENKDYNANWVALNTLLDKGQLKEVNEKIICVS